MSEKDAFDLWWEWATKSHESMFSIDGDIHYPIMELSPDERRDREKVNEAGRRYRARMKFDRGRTSAHSCVSGDQPMRVLAILALAPAEGEREMIGRQ